VLQLSMAFEKRSVIWLHSRASFEFGSSKTRGNKKRGQARGFNEEVAYDMVRSREGGCRLEGGDEEVDYRKGSSGEESVVVAVVVAREGKGDVGWR